MKTKLLLIAAVAVMIPLQAQAAVSVDTTTDATYIKNQGYSAQTADMINITKARAAGEEYYTKDEQAQMQNETSNQQFLKIKINS